MQEEEVGRRCANCLSVDFVFLFIQTRNVLACLSLLLTFLYGNVAKEDHSLRVI